VFARLPACVGTRPEVRLITRPEWEAVLSNEYEHSAAITRRATPGGPGQMPAGMMADLKSGAVGEADGMPVGSMNRAGQMPGAGSAGTGPLREMPPGGAGAFQEMPAGNMAAGAKAAPYAATFAEMPGAAPSGAPAAAAPGPDGAIVLAGTWRLNLTIGGQT
jgi:hypothetical protein